MNKLIDEVIKDKNNEGEIIEYNCCKIINKGKIK